MNHNNFSLFTLHFHKICISHTKILNYESFLRLMTRVFKSTQSTEHYLRFVDILYVETFKYRNYNFYFRIFHSNWRGDAGSLYGRLSFIYFVSFVLPNIFRYTYGTNELIFHIQGIPDFVPKCNFMLCISIDIGIWIESNNE